ncbi:phosphotransferase [Ornithinimicrobium sp. Y1694]|uniref:phosphotransferase n=1 Tax=Ornithinimicrobium sp. Y1694 TaxID=3418590 RepID=UPI003CF62EA0
MRNLALAALASAAVPGMKPVSVAGIRDDEHEDMGVQKAVVEDATGRRWVVHAPLDPASGARLRQHEDLVRQLARHVPFKVPAAVGYADLGRNGQAAVYPHVDGTALDFSRLPAGPGLASAVGRALAAVHNIAREVFEEQDVPTFDAAACRQRAIAEVDRAAETGRVPTGLLARWEEAFEAAPLWQFATVPVHGSFTGSSLLVVFGDEADAGSGRVVAVTGWEDAAVADPAVDLAELYAEASPRAWEAVLDSYSLARAHRPDPYLHARARLIAETRVLSGLARASSEGDEESARRIVEGLRRMDRLTEEDDSLVPVTARGRGALAAAPVATSSFAEQLGDDQFVEADEEAGDIEDVDIEAADIDDSDDVAHDHDVVEDLDHDLEDTGHEDADLHLGAVEAQEEQVPAHEDEAAEIYAEPGDEDRTIEVPVVSLEVETDESEVQTVESEVQTVESEVDTADSVESADPEAADDFLDDEERLHELYGMPDPDPDRG